MKKIFLAVILLCACAVNSFAAGLTSNLYLYDATTGGDVTSTTKEITAVLGIEGKTDDDFMYPQLIEYDSTIATAFNGDVVKVTRISAERNIYLPFNASMVYGERLVPLGNFKVEYTGKVRRGIVVTLGFWTGNSKLTASKVISFAQPQNQCYKGCQVP